MATQPHDHNNPSQHPKKVAQAQPPVDPDDLTPEELRRLEQAAAEVPADRPAEQQPPRPEVSNAEIDLGLIGPNVEGGEGSGISVVEWSSVLEEKPVADKGGEAGNEPVLDLDALDHGLGRDEEEAVSGSEGGIDLADLVGERESSDEPADEDSEGMIDLNALASEEGESDAIDLSSKEEVVEEMSGRGDSGVVDLNIDDVLVEEEARAGSESDVVDLGEDLVVVEQASPSSAIDAGAINLDMGMIEEDASPAPARESGVIDIGEEMVVEGAGESDVIDLGEDMVVIEEASASKGSGALEVSDTEVAEDEGADVLLGDEPRSYDSTSSGRDLIAEAVESGVGMEVADLDMPEEKRAGRVELNAERSAELPLSATGVTADVEEMDLEFLAKMSETSDVGGRSSAANAADLPLEKIEMESDAIDLAGLGDKIGDSSPSGVHSEEEVDLAALMAEQSNLEGKSDSRPRELAPSESSLEMDSEAVDLGSGESSSAALHRAALEEEGDVEDIGSGSAKGLRIDDLASDEEEALAEDEAEAEAMGEPSPEGEGLEETVPAKAPSKAGAWIGGTVLGTVVGAGACFALIFFSLIPGVGPIKETPAGPSRPNPVAPPPQPAAGPALTAADYMRFGDLAKAKQAGIEKMGENPKDLALRGQYRWEDYLVNQGRTNAALNSEDAPVKQAIDDLKKSDTADALFALGQLQEMTNKPQEAEQTYKQGVAKFQNDRRFPAGLLRLEATQEAAPAVQENKPAEEKKDGMTLRPATATEAALLAVLLVGLQAPGANQPQAQGEAEEAGLPFWEALKLAREQKYPEALAKLDEARRLHDQRRKLLPRKPQNPTTDPNELIFLQACDELKTYWLVRDHLQKGGYLKNLADRNAPSQAVASVLKDLNDARVSQAAVTKKLVDDKIIAKSEDLSTGIDTLLVDRKNAIEKVLDLEKKVTTATKDLDDLKKVQVDLSRKLIDDKIIAKPEELGSGLDTLLADRKTDAKKIMDLGQMLTVAKKDVTDRDDMLTRLQKELFGAKYIDKENDRTQLLPGVQRALADARIKDAGGELRDLRKQKDDLATQLKQEQTASKQMLEKEKSRLMAERDKAVADLKEMKDKELATLKAESEKKTTTLEKQLAQRRPPAEMLAIWLPVLEGADREQSQRAEADANVVLGDPMAPAEVKSHARVIQGLALRNLDKFAEARPVLTEALVALPAGERDWRAATETALKEVSDPLGYFSTRTEESRNRRDLPAARATLDRGIKVLGDNNAALLAQRSLLSLELARSRAEEGRVQVNDPDLAQALKDAAEAIKKTEGKDDQKEARALAFYARGRLSEEVGESADAVENYRSAIREHPGADAVGSRYRIALARLLAQPRQGRPPLPPAPREEEKKKEDAKIGQLPSQEQVRQLLARAQTDEQARETLAVLLVVGLQPPAPVQPDQAEAVRLADEIIRQYEQNPASVPLDVLANAYAVKGMWTRALLIYADFLKPALRPDLYEGLMLILRNHPQIRRPETLRPPNPFEAETQYALGLRFYFGRCYSEAAQHFQSAIDYDNQDARYFYFLGLSRLMLGETDAAEAFELGARLEKQNKPASAAISISLERVQGPARKVLNEYRLGIR